MPPAHGRRPRGAALLALIVAVLAVALPGSAAATPITFSKGDVPGARKAGASGAALRSALAGAMRGGPRGAVRKAPAAASAWKIGSVRLLAGSVELRSPGAAKAAKRAASRRTSVGKRASTATASVQAGPLVGFVRVQAKGRDKTVRATADAYARALQGLLAASANETVADRLAEHATASKQDALALFQIAYGGMPGAKVPAGRRGALADGTLAITRVLSVWQQLSPAQRAAFDRAVGNPVSGGASRAHRADAPRAHRESLREQRAQRLALTPDPVAQAMADGFVTAYMDPSRVGAISPPKVQVLRSSVGIGATADSFPVDAKGKGAAYGSDFDHCRIRLDPKYYSKETANGKAFALAHEVFHCITFRITDNWGTPSRDWVTEGLANWAASQITPAVTDTLGYQHYTGWLQHPGQQLFSLAYRAVGFWGHQNERLGNLWPRVKPLLTAGDNDATFDAAGGNVDDPLATSAAGFLRTPGAPGPWIQSQPWAVSDATVHTPRGATSAASAPITVAAHANRLTDVLPLASKPVLELTRSKGHVRATDGGSGDYEDAASRWFCLPAGSCVCPPDETAHDLPPAQDVASLTVALSGDTGGGAAQVTRHAMKEYCSKDKDPQKIGDRGSAGSNGDPHLTTLDGLRYDFQAAGEFLLARSGNDLEIQGRQEPWKIGRTTVKTVTINTQLAMRVGGARVTFSPGSGDVPAMRVSGGAPQTPAPGTQVSVGSGQVRSDGDGLVVLWPDGSRADVYGVGVWGVAFTLALPDSRKGKVSGLLGDFDGSAYDDLKTRSGKAIDWTPAALDWPGLSRVRVSNPEDPKFFDALYDKVGDSWRISQKESLFDYGKGETTKTFTDTAIPTRPVDYESLSAAKRAAAEATCRAAGVTIPAALEDCVLDVVLTGQSAFATAAAKEQSLVSLTQVGWQRLSAGATRYGPVSVARTGDGTLHLVWEDRDASSKRSVVADALPAGGGESGAVQVAPFDTTPYAFAAPDGGLRMVGAVIDLGPPVTEGIVQFGTSAPYASWSAMPMVVSPGAYVGEPMAAFAGGHMLTVSGLAGNGRVYRDTGTGSGGGESLNGTLSADCYAMKPAIASTGSETYAAWWQWDCPQTGLFVAPIDPATGKPGDEVAVPNSTWDSGAGTTAWDSIGLDRLSLAARAGGGVYLAYARQDGSTWSVLLWRIGSPAPMVAASGLSVRPDSLQVSAEPTSGALWVAWESQDVFAGKGRLAVRRTTPGGDAWAGDIRQIAFPSDAHPNAAPTHPWDVLARDGALDVIAGYPATSDFPGALWRGVVNAG